MSACTKCGFEHYDEQTCSEHLLELKALEVASSKVLAGDSDSVMVELTSVTGNRKVVEVYRGSDGSVHNRNWYPTGIHI